MAITASVPTLWSARILEHLDGALVGEQAFGNRNYEGDVMPGAILKLLKIADGTIEDYTGTLSAPTDLTDSNPITLTVDQAKAFNFKVDDVDQEKSVLKLIDEGSKRRARLLQAAADSYIFAMHSQVDSANAYGNSTTPIVIGFGGSDVKPSDGLAELQERLDNANVLRSDRRAALPPWYIRMLRKELGLRETALGDDVVKTGEVLTYDGLRIFMSPNIANTTGTKYKCLVGQPDFTFAQAILKTETYRVEAAFATGVKGLHVYGGILTQPLAMAVGTFNKGTN